MATGYERTNVQDVGYGFRQLVDVAARALSPGINDPTTAVHVIGHLSVLLCRLAGRNLGPSTSPARTGRSGWWSRFPDLKDFLDMAMNQPRQYGAADLAVAGRLLGLLQELTWCDRLGRYRREIVDHLGRIRNAIGAANYRRCRTPPPAGAGKFDRRSAVTEAPARKMGKTYEPPAVTGQLIGSASWFKPWL